MTMPNFLIIGAAKSGTTSLYRYLQQHPQIYMSSLKETNFFAYEGQPLDFQWWAEPPKALLRSITDLGSYQAQFQAVSDESAIGEASPFYLYSPTAAARIRHHIPDVKLIVILRHPVDRAFSHFSHLMRDNREPCSSFAQALQEEEGRMAANWSWDYNYRDMGFYSVQLKRYFDRFDPAQIKIFLYEELNHDPLSVLKEIFHFLEVDENVIPDTSFRYNVSGNPKNRAVQDVMMSESHPIKTMARMLLPQKLRRRMVTYLRDQNLERQTLSPETRRQLLSSYREDILNLQELIHKNLKKWL